MNKMYPFVLLLAGCGTYVGNPRKNDGGSPTKEFAPPEIDFVIPSGVATYDDDPATTLNLSSPSDLSGFLLNANEQMRLTQAGVELLKAIKKTNRIIRKVSKEEKITGEGKTSKSLNTAKLSVEYKSISADGYTSSMHVCYDGSNLLYMRWNDLGKKEIYHSGSPKILSRSSENIMSRISVDPSLLGGLISLENSGDTDDNFEVIRSFRSSLITFESSGTKYLSYSKAVSADETTFIPTRYLLAKFDSAALGSYVFWERQCRLTHKEPSDGSGGWCKGSALTQGAGFGSDGERNEAAQEIISKGASITKASDLKKIVFPVTCGS